MFSVIIPLYNKSKYIEKALFSVLNQTYPFFEVIVINDGSTDDGCEKVKKITNDKIRLLSQPNSGVSTARNNGVKLAKYDFIAFLAIMSKTITLLIFPVNIAILQFYFKKFFCM